MGDPSETRLIGLDLARAFAILGMVWVNFRLTMGVEPSTPLAEFLAGVLDGRAAALFVVLAGVGVTLMSRRARASGDLSGVRLTLLKRSGFLLILGLLFAVIWPPDILHFYGVYLFAAAWILGDSSRRLLTFAVGMVIVACVLILTLEYDAGWKSWETFEYLDFWSVGGFIRNTFFNGFHPFFPWAGFLCFGMWLGRQRLFERRTCWAFVLGSMVIAVGIELLSSRLIPLAVSSGALTDEEAKAVFGTEMMPPMPLYMVAATAWATAVIGICARIGAAVGDAAWLKPLIHTGQLALTLYVAHVVFGIGILFALGLVKNQQSLDVAVVATIVFCFVSIVFSHLWRERFSRGPLEILFRRLSG